MQPGSVFRGHTSEDASDLSDAAPSMYRVTSSNASRSSWTCNGDHVLVLQFNEAPSAVDVETRRDHTRTFCFRAFSREQDGEVVQRTFDFPSRAEAEQARARALAEWRPLVWECTVDQFLACSDAVRDGATMFQPDLVHFSPPSNTLLKRLSAAVETRPEQLSESLVKHTGSFAITHHSMQRLLPFCFAPFAKLNCARVLALCMFVVSQRGRWVCGWPMARRVRLGWTRSVSTPVAQSSSSDWTSGARASLASARQQRAGLRFAAKAARSSLELCLRDCCSRMDSPRRSTSQPVRFPSQTHLRA